MAKSKIDATDRLRQDGRWQEAQRYRDAQRTRLREEGLSRKEAAERAWQLMIERFPLLEAPEEQGEEEPDIWTTRAKAPPT